MYVNPFPFGIFIGAVCTLTIEVIALIIYALNKGGKK